VLIVYCNSPDGNTCPMGHPVTWVWPSGVVTDECLPCVCVCVCVCARSGVVFSHFAWHSLAHEAQIGASPASHKHTYILLGRTKFDSIIALPIRGRSVYVCVRMCAACSTRFSCAVLASDIR
jgi:hypothetical protein